MSFSEVYTDKLSKIALFSTPQRAYNSYILKDLEAEYIFAINCKKQGRDSSLSVESQLTIDMPERIEKTFNIPVAERLRELLKQFGIKETAIKITEEIALGKFGFYNPDQSLDLSIRVGLAVITEGVNTIPLQGISTIKTKYNEDGSKYVAVSFTTLIKNINPVDAALCIVIADRVRKSLGLDNYRTNAWGEDEIGRVIEELRIYEYTINNFRFRISNNDIKKTILHIPVEIDGVDTNPNEVVIHRDMKRIETNRVRGGALYVLNDCIIGRSKKLKEILDSLGINGWDWLAELEGGELTDELELGVTNFNDLISWRPVLAKPFQTGGFRLRYGRSFNTGISTIGINPTTAEILDYPIVIGTQIKTNILKKGGTVGFVDSIDGPIVRLKNGSVIFITDIEEAKNLKNDIEKVLFLGDILIGFGDFLENNTKLFPSGYTEELWASELESKLQDKKILDTSLLSINRIKLMIKDPFTTIPTFDEAVFLAKELNIGLHPRYLFYFDLVTPPDILNLRRSLKFQDDLLVVNENLKEIKIILEKIGIPHIFNMNTIIIDNKTAKILAMVLALNKDTQIPAEWTNTCDFISKLAGFPIRNKSSTFVGIKVGRPETATIRKMKPPAHILFPIGKEDVANYDIMNSSKTEYITIELVNLVCNNCNSESFSAKCDKCGSEAKIKLLCPKCKEKLEVETCPNCKIATRPFSEKRFPIKQKIIEASRKVRYRPNVPFRGVENLVNSTRIPEPLEKGILRLKHNLSVYKDGTTRFNITNAPLSHCTANMINVSIETLKKLGYNHDIYGNELVRENQLFELFIQDIVIPYEATNFLFNTANFIDDLLVYVYEQEPFYKLRSKDDIIGHLVIGLAPTTSVGILGRVIGFTSSQVCFAHPLWHSAKRRDCSGDKDSIMLLLDAFLNFSRDYLPAQIGGLSDTPLMIQPVIVPHEIQKQIGNLDIMTRYPLEFYEKANAGLSPLKIAQKMTLAKNKLNTEEIRDFNFTHPTSNISTGPPTNNYSAKTTIAFKLEKQIELAKKIEAVDPNEVVTSILKTYILPDIIGNINAYTSQMFRCKSCGYQYRRLPIRGNCLKCGGELQATVTKGTVEKYLKLATKLSNEFNIDEYTKARLQLVVDTLKTLFKTEPIQSNLSEFL